MRGPSPDQFLSETAQLAYHFHWPLDTILDLEHADRRRFLAEAQALAARSTTEHALASQWLEPAPLLDGAQED